MSEAPATTTPEPATTAPTDPAAAPAATAAAPATTAPASTVPESYSWTWPEGFTADPAIMAEYEKDFREAGLSNEAAQKIVGRYAEQQLAASKAFTESLESEVQKQTDAWKATVQNDPELGGAKFTATVKSAETAMARFGSPELKTWLDTTGMANHPELVRFFAKVGQLAGEDRFVAGGARPGAARNSIESRMYPNSQH